MFHQSDFRLFQLSFILLLLGASFPVRAQEAEPTSPVPRPGFQVRSLAAFVVYDSKFVPGGVLVGPGFSRLRSDLGAGGSADFAWMHLAERTNIVVDYSPSYIGRARYS